MSAGFSKVGTIAFNGYGDDFKGFAASMVIGGTASVIGGGKFANGAATAAFGYLFNYCAHYDCTRGLVKGIGSGIGSYFKGVLYDLPKHALAVNGVLGEASRAQALAGERVVIDSLNLIRDDPQQAMKIACIACMNLSPEQESNLQGRLGSRLATAGAISVLSGPVGAAASVGAITGNLLNAGVNLNSQADVMRAILFGNSQ